MGAVFKSLKNTEKTAIISTQPTNGYGNNGYVNNYSVFANDYGAYGNVGQYGGGGGYGAYGNVGQYGGGGGGGYGGCGYGSGLSPKERRMLKCHFDSLAGRDRTLSFQEFVILFGRVNPHLTGPQLVNMAERAFLYYDSNRTGYMSFDEFVSYFLDARSSFNNNSNSTYGYVRRPRYESPYSSSGGYMRRPRPQSRVRDYNDDYEPRPQQRVREIIDDYVPRASSRRMLEIEDSRDEELYRDEELPYRRRSSSSSVISATTRGRKRVEFSSDDKDDRDPFGTKVIHKDTVEYI